MKYSGIEWIGEIPDSWNIRKVKQCFYISKEQAHEENPTILSLARAGVKVRDISNNEGQLAASYDNYNPVMPGDLLLNPMDLYSGANCSLSEVSGVISPAYINLRKKVELNPKFYDYYFKTQYWAMAMFAHGKGVSFDNRWTMNAETLLNYYLPFPSSNVQDKIVDLINKKTTEIDSLIEIENQQIEKLKEYKQAVVTQAVTKGLDKNAIMKDSGVEWIGKVPNTWKSGTIKRVTKKITCGVAATPEYVEEENGVLFLSAQNIQNDKIDLSTRRYINNDLYNKITKNTKPEKGDLLQVRVGASIGKCAIIDIDDVFGIYVSLSLIKPNELVISKFLYYYLQTSTFRKMSELYIDYAGSQGNLNVEDIKKIYIPIPSIKEQEAICDYIDRKVFDLNKIIGIKQQKIEKLEEYKKSLIYEYVTGKKEGMA